jgi:hypothetical protein
VTATGTVTIRAHVVGTVGVTAGVDGDGLVLPLDTSLPADLAYPGAASTTGPAVATGFHSATTTLTGSVGI